MGAHTSPIPNPVVTIAPARGVPTAGQTFSLTCSVVSVPGLVVEPNIQWTRQDGTAVSNPSSLELNFDPVQTSDGDLYTCQASIDRPDIGVSVSEEESAALTVRSKFAYQINCSVMWHTFPSSTSAQTGHYKEPHWCSVCWD